jgi:hypothetical protein
VANGGIVCHGTVLTAVARRMSSANGAVRVASFYATAPTPFRSQSLMLSVEREWRGGDNLSPICVIRCNQIDPV